ncbi:TolC family protein [bacterium]|nr:TolC family protein [bacterium]
MKRLLLLLLPVFIYGETLQSLLEAAKQNNKLVNAQTLTKHSKQKELDAQKSSYYPTLDVGAYYQSLHERTPMMPGDVYSGYAKAGFDIYDGGKRAALVNQKSEEFKASSYDEAELKQNISLQITQNFFTIKSLESSRKAMEKANISLLAQLKRVSAFYDAKLATKDEIDRLQAAYDTNIYNIEAVKLDILKLKQSVELQIAKKVDTLESSHFKELYFEGHESVDAIKSLEFSRNAIKSFSDSVASLYYPQIRLEDTFSLYGYNNTDALHPEGVENQNKLMLSANFRLYDAGVVKENKQALELNAQALSQQIEYKNDEQKMNYEIARATIDTNKIKIKSAKSALVAASSAYETIEQKYNAGIVDNVAYLDALAAQMSATALYETSLNDLEIAYAFYYYYSGKNIEEFLQ